LTYFSALIIASYDLTKIPIRSFELGALLVFLNFGIIILSFFLLASRARRDMKMELFRNNLNEGELETLCRVLEELRDETNSLSAVESEDSTELVDLNGDIRTHKPLPVQFLSPSHVRSSIDLFSVCDGLFSLMGCCGRWSYRNVSEPEGNSSDVYQPSSPSFPFLM
jgi:hypothetical protein